MTVDAVVRRPQAPSTQIGSTLGALWATLAALPWLVPNHSVPWTTFDAELCMAIAMLVLMVGALVVLRRPDCWLDAQTLGWLLAASIPLFQAAAGLYSVPTEAPLIAMYLVGAGLTAWTARTAEARSPGTVAGLLLSSFMIAAVVSSLIGVLHWLRIVPATILVAPPSPEPRVVANVGQPNNLATLLVWGLVGLWWLWSTGRAHAVLVVAAAALCLFGVVLTVSRAGLVEIVLLTAAAYALRKRLPIGRPTVWFGLAAWTLGSTLLLPWLTHTFVQELPRSIVDMASPRERTTLLHLDFAEISARPWFGWGWNQNIVGHVALAEQFPMHGQAGNAHNLLLDLLIWNGIPLGLLLTGVIAAWAWHAFRRNETPEQTFCKIALLTLGTHTMLELPHMFAYFLLPAAALAGTLSTGLRAVRIPRWMPWAAACGAGVYLVALTSDYLTIEENLRSARMRSARIAGAAAESNPPMHVLSSLQHLLYVLRTEPVRGMSPDALDDMERAAKRFPVVSGLFRFAHAAALNQRPEKARWALSVLCNLRPEGECATARKGWAELQAHGANPELSIVKTPWGPAAARLHGTT